MAPETRRLPPGDWQNERCRWPREVAALVEAGADTTYVADLIQKGADTWASPAVITLLKYRWSTK
jgi:hypothetical protein